MTEKQGTIYVKLWAAITTLLVGTFIHGAVAVAYLHNNFLSKTEFSSVQIVRDQLLFNSLKSIEDSLIEMKEDIRALRQTKQDKP